MYLILSLPWAGATPPGLILHVPLQEFPFQAVSSRVTVLSTWPFFQRTVPWMFLIRFLYRQDEKHTCLQMKDGIFAHQICKKRALWTPCFLALGINKDVSSREQTLNYEASQVDDQVRGLPERFPGKLPWFQGTEEKFRVAVPCGFLCFFAEMFKEEHTHPMPRAKALPSR